LRTKLALALVTAIAAVTFGAPGHAADTAQQANMKSCAANWNGMAAGAKSKTTYKDYMSTCLKAPASAAPVAMTAKPAAATPAAMTAKPAAKAEAGSAKCKDGKTVTYTHRSGTCSGHGGVASWM
jgi:hypothetical protein